MKKQLILLCVFLSLILGACSDHKEELGVDEEMFGKWQGELEIPGSQLTIILNLKEEAASLSVPAQGLTEAPFNEVFYTGNKLSLNMNLSGTEIKVVGTYDDDQIEGTFTQSGQSFKFILTPYVEEEVTYERINVPVQGGDLKAALQLPEGDGPFPVAIIIAGSGPTDKDGNTIGGGKNNSLKMVAEELAAKGFASIRYDKRGIGENQQLAPKEEDLTIDQLVDDVKKLIGYADAERKFSEIHVIGHSEGSLIGMLAVQNSKVASYTSIAGPGRPADEILKAQLEGQLTPELMDKTQSILKALKAGKTVDDVPTDLQMLFRKSVQPYLISWLKYDPSAEIGKVDKPVLIIQGTHDIQVPVEEAELLKSGKPKADFVLIEGMNHVLKDAPSDVEGNASTYKDPTLPLASDFMNSIINFIKE
ncbi:alpha/beta hydrolase family protein [Chungangia koreensis]|uniref:Alpha/beta hydrolase family protein n=1 Tax=Chungangia koreensis TaxID=752657 RepID=A0ABV8X4I6_9LACT